MTTCPNAKDALKDFSVVCLRQRDAGNPCNEGSIPPTNEIHQADANTVNNQKTEKFT